MQFTTLLTLAAVGLGASAQAADCDYPTFKLVNPLYSAWGSGKYAVMYPYTNGEFWFNTNDSSEAFVFTLESSTKQLFSGTNLGYWLGQVEGHDAAVRFDTPSSVSSNSEASVITCDIPTADGETFTCHGDNSGNYNQWDMCYMNNGGIGLNLVWGNSTGPYTQPHPIRNWLYCGGLRVEVAELGCGEAPA